MVRELEDILQRGQRCEVSGTGILVM